MGGSSRDARRVVALDRNVLLLASLLVIACGGDPDRGDASAGADASADARATDAGFVSTCAPGVLTVGATTVVDCTLARLPEASRWWYAPAYIEGPIACPFPSDSLQISAPHVAFSYDAPADVTIDARLELFASTPGGDTGLLIYPGRGAPTTPEAARACLGIDYAALSVPVDITSVEVAAGTSVTFVVWNFFGEGPTDFRLSVTARPR